MVLLLSLVFITGLKITASLPRLGPCPGWEGATREGREAQYGLSGDPLMLPGGQLSEWVPCDATGDRGLSGDPMTLLGDHGLSGDPVMLSRDSPSAAGLCSQLGTEDSSAQNGHSPRSQKADRLGLSPRWPQMAPYTGYS